MKKLLDGFRYDAHPMGMLIGVVGALSTFYPDAKKVLDPGSRRLQTFRLIAKMPTLAAFAYRHSIGMRYTYPDNDLSYTGNFLKMTFAMTEKYKPNPVLERALEVIDVAGRATLDALPPFALDDEHLRRAGQVDPDGWWTRPAQAERRP